MTPTRHAEHALSSESSIRYAVREALDAQALNGLFAAAWGSPKPDYERVLARSFTWISAHSRDDLVGFVNVAWDGGVHFFLLDTTVHPDWARKGIGRRLVDMAIDACRGRGEWLHVDADEGLMSRFYERCGFERTPAGLLSLAPATRPR